VSDTRKLVRQGVLDRVSLIAASLELVQLQGIEGLSMRPLADRLGVKAASLYWHVRDRRELLELLAASLLEQVPLPDPIRPWHVGALELCEAFRVVVARQRDSARILLEVPDAVEASSTADRLRRLLVTAGLPPPEAAEAASMLLFHVVVGQLRSIVPGTSSPEPGRPASVTIETGSRGVTIRAGAAMDTLIRAPRETVAAAGVTVAGSNVIIRRLRGTRHAEVELNPLHPWSIRVQGGTWNTRLQLSGLEVREIQLDGGASRVDCVLPIPHGVVPIDVSGGVLGVKLHRPAGTAATAKVSSGALQVRLDAFSTKAAILDAHWASADARVAGNRYELRISGGAIQVSLDETARPKPFDVVEIAAGPVRREPGSAIELLLNGIERRVAT
jgi:AcrR family transcriptional regulator